MKKKALLNWLVPSIAALSILASTAGIFSNDGGGSYTYKSVRGKEVLIYGKGLYKHMSAEVAPQGIAQDYVTLFIAVPLLLLSLILTNRGSHKGKILLTGIVGYFLATYLFFLVMGMYNVLFLVFVALLGLAFYSFILLMQSFNAKENAKLFSEKTPVKCIGGFLIFTAVSIAVLWLSIVVPPLLDGSVVPLQAEHYTTLIVQGLDLSVLLPAAFIVGALFYKKRAAGYLWAPVYLVFLSLLMTALTAKIIAMAKLGYNVIPAVFIIPAFNLIAILYLLVVLKNIRKAAPITLKQTNHVTPVLAN